MLRLLRFLPRRWWSPQGWRTWNSYVHWRMETYGVYYPTGEKNQRALKLMLGQLPSYLRWIKELDGLRRKDRLN